MRISGTSQGYDEIFGFSYGPHSSSMMLAYDETSPDQHGMYVKYIDKPVVKRISYPFVVIDFAVDEHGNYDNLIEYSCSQAGPVVYEEIRLGSRNAMISNEDLTLMKETLDASGVKYRELKYVSHSPQCMYKC
jgi:hypothetical protein